MECNLNEFSGEIFDMVFEKNIERFLEVIIFYIILFSTLLIYLSEIYI